jgi:hypothetical protein
MEREYRSVLRYILSTGDLDLDEDRIHALMRICQDRIAYLNQGRGFYLIPSLDSDREDMWFVVDDTVEDRALMLKAPYDYKTAKKVAQRLNTRREVRHGPLSDIPGRGGVYHRVGCIRTDATLSYYADCGLRCEYCAIGP